MIMRQAGWRSRDSGDSSRTCHLGAIALLHALLLTSVCAEDRSFRGISEHSFKQTPVSVPKAIGTCVKDSSQPCKSWQRAGNAIDFINQCHTSQAMSTWESAAILEKNQPTCSADYVGSTADSGSCICGEGFCADTDMLCHRGTYQVINEVFSIIPKAYPQEKLYMTWDGKIMVGYPPDPRAAQWRISVTGQGVKLLWTDLYPHTIMHQYESCTTMTDQFGLPFTKCVGLVGHVADPRASEMGWYIELHGGFTGHHIGPIPQEYLQLASANTGEIIYISPSTKEALSCEARGRDCPGDAGAFRFDPPLLQRQDFTLDNAPGTLPVNLESYFATVCVAGILICCLSCAFNTAPSSSRRGGVRDILLVPFWAFATALGFRGGGAKI